MKNVCDLLWTGLNRALALFFEWLIEQLKPETTLWTWIIELRRWLTERYGLELARTIIAVAGIIHAASRR